MHATDHRFPHARPCRSYLHSRRPCRATRPFMRPMRGRTCSPRLSGRVERSRRRSSRKHCRLRVARGTRRHRNSSSSSSRGSGRSNRSRSAPCLDHDPLQEPHLLARAATFSDKGRSRRLQGELRQAPPLRTSPLAARRGRCCPQCRRRSLTSRRCHCLS